MDATTTTTANGWQSRETKTDSKTTVAHIAYLSSDVVLSVQPTQKTDSAFSTHLKRNASNKLPSLARSEGGVPEVRTPYLTSPVESQKANQLKDPNS